MTAKRFYYAHGVVWDSEKPNGLNGIAINDLDRGLRVVDWLNEQHEQIQELIQSSKELEEDCQSTFNAMSRKQDDLYRKNFKLKEENGELKQQLSDIKGQLLMLDNCDNWDYDRMKHTVREIAKIIGYGGTINPKKG